MHGGGTVAEFHVSLLTRVLRGAQAWYLTHPNTSPLSRKVKKQLVRKQYRAHRFVPVRQTADPREKILALQDSRELLDDYALLAAATAAAQAYGPLEPSAAVHTTRQGLRPPDRGFAPRRRRGSTVAWAA